MKKTITIESVTRIEGHAKITLHMDKEGPRGRRPVSCNPGARF